MSDPINDGGPALCAWCDQPRARRQGRIFLCAKHYRFQQMRTRAARDGKTVPSYWALDAMAAPGLICCGCQREMHWLVSDGPRSQQVTLQHDRGCTMRLLCLGCQVRHASHPGDEFYNVPVDHKRCPDCVAVLPLDRFSVDRSRPIGRASYCKECSRVRHAQWVKEHRDHVNTKQRERRAARHVAC